MGGLRYLSLKGFSTTEPLRDWFRSQKLDGVQLDSAGLGCWRNRVNGTTGLSEKTPFLPQRSVRQK